MTYQKRLAQWAVGGMVAALLVACGGGGSNTSPPGGDASTGAKLLVDVQALADKSQCPNGGNRLVAGLDSNANGVLETAEVSQSQVVCWNASLPDAPMRMSARSEAPGTHCASGGLRVSVWMDTVANGVLDSSEAESVSYICTSSVVASPSTLLALQAEPPGGNCVNGGTRLTSGQDRDGNGTLEEAEVTASRFVCNGASGVGNGGSDGLNGLMDVAPEPAGAQCAAGGSKVRAGLDANRNGALDISEVSSTQYVCHGSASRTLVLQTAEPAGANCAAGGTRISVGADTNANGTLDGGEIESTSYVCQGATGAAGLDSLIAMVAEPAGAHCTAGGSRINAGKDTNRNGVLDASEITATSYACHGATGPAGAAGATGAGVAVFTSSGSYVVPSGVHGLVIEAWGGGGAGGSLFNCNNGACAQFLGQAFYDANATGGGGGSGAYQKVFLSVSPGDVLTVAAGSAGTVPGSGTTAAPPPPSGSGGTSSVTYQSTQVISATGGAAGTHYIYNSADGNQTWGTAGSGGLAGFVAPALGMEAANGQAGTGSQGAGVAGYRSSGGNGARNADQYRAANGMTGMVILTPAQ